MFKCDECKHIDNCVRVPYGCECFELDLEKHDKQIREEVIDEILPLIKDIRGLCRSDVLKDLIEKVELLKE